MGFVGRDLRFRVLGFVVQGFGVDLHPKPPSTPRPLHPPALRTAESLRRLGRMDPASQASEQQ